MNILTADAGLDVRAIEKALADCKKNQKDEDDLFNACDDAYAAIEKADKELEKYKKEFNTYAKKCGYYDTF